MQTSFRLNGRQVKLHCDPTERLTYALRERLKITGTKVGCNAGDCGACTVIIDGEACCACLVGVGQIDGSVITTVEGLFDESSISGLQQEFIENGAAQCGICIPGMLVSAAALIGKNKAPTRKEVEHAIGGVLCRCTGYSKIISSILNFTRKKTKTHKNSAVSSKVIGRSLQRIDGQDKVTGSDKFGADDFPADALLARVVRSPYSHADFNIEDLALYKKENPGIVCVLTARDIPGENCFGVIPEFADQPILAETRTRYPGEGIAVIVGHKKTIEKLDLNEFPVKWNILKPVNTMEQAQADGALLLHQNRKNNILTQGYVKRGNIEKGFRNSKYIAQGSFTTPFIEHAYIEPEAGYAIRKNNRIEIHGCTQAPYMNRDSIARIMGLPATSVRVIPTSCGGGFGSKLDLSYHPYIALAAWTLDRPVGIVYTRQESMQSTTKRHPSDIEIKIGCDPCGKISALKFEGNFNTGAYASWGPTVANRVPVHASGPYKIPNYMAKSRAIHTTTPNSGAFRGFGVPQTAIALETTLSELASAAGIDELDFRLLNCLRNGDPTVTGQSFETGVGIKSCLEAIKPKWKQAIKSASSFNKNTTNPVDRRGVGIASCWYGCGNTSMSNPSTIRVGLTKNSQIVLHQGATDIGQGSNTVITQILADAIGASVDCIELVGADTDITPDAGKTSASRQTFITGGAATLAGMELRRQILRYANAGEDAQLIKKGTSLYIKNRSNLNKLDLSHLPANQFGYVLMAEETYDPPTTPLDENGQGNPYAVYGYGVHLVELTVDTELGKICIDHITAAHDVGRAINPNLIEGQIEGGIAQGIGLALMEEYKPFQTENLHDYLIPTSGDIPKIDTIIIEEPDWVSPHGAKGLGEHVLIPTAPAILNAIRYATGATVKDLPATPDKVFRAIQKAKNTNE